MKRIDNEFKPDAGLEAAALLAQATPAAADRLQELAETTSDKASRKAARRALYQLSQRGIIPQATIPRVLTTSSQPALSAHASIFDGAGNRVLFFIWPDPDGGSPTFSQLLLHDSEGVKGIETSRIARRDLAARLGNVAAQRETGVALAEIEPDYGRFLLHQARRLNQQHRQRTPPGFLDIISMVGEPEQSYRQSPVWSVFSPDEIQSDADLPRDPAALFRLLWFEAWFLDIEDVNPWLQPVLDISARLNTSDKLQRADIVEIEQRQALDAIAKEAAAALLKDDNRARYVRRLEESADILRRCQHEMEARQALFHAMDLRDSITAAESPFAVLLVQRTLQAAVEMTRA